MRLRSIKDPIEFSSKLKKESTVNPVNLTIKLVLGIKDLPREETPEGFGPIVLVQALAHNPEVIDGPCYYASSACAHGMDYRSVSDHLANKVIRDFLDNAHHVDWTPYEKPDEIRE